MYRKQHVGEHMCVPWEHMLAVNQYYVHLITEQGYLPSRHSAFTCFVLKLFWAVQSWKRCHRKLIQKTETNTLLDVTLLCHVMSITCIFGLPCTPAMLVSHEICSLDGLWVRALISGASSLLAGHEEHDEMETCEFIPVDDAFVERVRNKSMEKIRDPAGIRTQDLPSTSQTLLPLSHSTNRGSERKLPESTLQTITRCN